MSKALKDSPPSLLDFSQQWPIMESICSGPSFRDIVSLSRTSKRVSILPETMSRTQLNINSILKHFFKDPETLRLKMAQTNAIISWYYIRRDDKFSSSHTLIRVTHALIPSILAALGCFPDTSSANYITWSKAYSLFPNSVLRHEALWLYGPHPGYDQMMPKYVKNGWKLIMPSPLEYSRTSSETKKAMESDTTNISYQIPSDGLATSTLGQ
ncbi:uncharacterized protein Bfra_002192 [Botrytis fragariae]|uniref:Uncharacterized protein n=1 Tax=Botrytis fragariae TaxID=1964551 RepID=A0A8H6B2F7_9HELO|nr:uncharacterized protein Bfra_002192 [Botrytis fragariae]KAF5877822.1 hypothetical protein Bfra_002192 [Botrytis fragariae]